MHYTQSCGGVLFHTLAGQRKGEGVKPEIGPRHERRHSNLRFDPFLNYSREVKRIVQSH